MEQNKQGDIITVFGNPLKFKNKIGQAKLIQKISDDELIENWFVEFTNDEGHTYEAKINKFPYGKNQ
jgi:hypothetical protein